jgi:hypothetical protein
MLEEMLALLGYKPEDDSWDTDGRRTYVNDDDLTHAFFTQLMNGLLHEGWQRAGANGVFADGKSSNLWIFRKDNEIIEMEPGGADATGHYLHLMKAETVQ